MLRMSQQVLLGLDPDKVNPAVSWLSETLVLAVRPWEAKWGWDQHLVNLSARQQTEGWQQEMFAKQLIGGLPIVA
jgi:hypothetical protein